jgi:ubiquinone biosynthesis protein
MESLGGMLVKLGQQLSLRTDVLPQVYCDELRKLLDDAPPFPVDEAIRTIEAETRLPLSEIFTQFNRKPIASASIACVYEAWLHSGTRVAVKVRRPEIKNIYARDFRAFDWTVNFLEFLTVVPQGMLGNFKNELRDIFAEELDFTVEARYQELYRIYMKRRKGIHVTAPRVFYKWTRPSLLVSEFVTGISLMEIKRAIDSHDEAHLAYLRELDIHPHVIAKRLIRASHYTFYECPFFHGDPHPGNIFVRPGNKIVLVDFGACGVFSARDRSWMWQMHDYYSRGDVAGMVQCVLGIMEPLPLMNVDEFKSDLTQEWWHGYYGLKSKHAAWWERTSYRLWNALLRLVRKHKISMPLNLFRMIRATLLYDTVAAQLYPGINVFKEFRKYHDRATEHARERLLRSVILQTLTGPSNETSFRIEQAFQTANDLIFQVQQFLRGSHFNFTAIPDKIFSAIDTGVDFFRTSLLTTIVLGGASWISLIRNKESISFYHPETWPLSVQVSLGLLVFAYLLYVYLYSKKILFRFREPDNYSYRRGT